MKVKTLVLAGVSSVVLAGAANAAEITAVQMTAGDFAFGDFGATGLQTYQLWLTGLDAGDVLLSIFGDPTSPMTLMTDAADGFFNETELGQGSLQGNPALFASFPGLQWDTYLAGFGADTSTSPGFPDTALAGGGSSIVGNDNIAWFDGDPTTASGETDGMILIGQVSTVDGAVISGTLSAQIRNAAGEEIRHRDLQFVIPAPGALALLGLAGLAGRRRRA